MLTHDQIIQSIQSNKTICPLFDFCDFENRFNLNGNSLVEYVEITLTFKIPCGFYARSMIMKVSFFSELKTVITNAISSNVYYEGRLNEEKLMEVIEEVLELKPTEKALKMA